MKPHFVIETGLVLAASLLFCLPQFATAQGNLVINGGFDTDASWWTVTNVSAGGGYSSNIGNPAGSVFLSDPDFGFSVPSPTASQQINSLTPGTIYTISGDYRKGGGKNLVDNTFGVALDGVFLFEGATPADYSWYSFSFEYQATSPSALLSLSAQINGRDNAYYIDNIAMYATPEPSPSWLLLLGSGVLFYVRNRKQPVR